MGNINDNSYCQLRHHVPISLGKEVTLFFIFFLLNKKTRKLYKQFNQRVSMKARKGVSKEFQQWLDRFDKIAHAVMKEDEELLKELAKH